MEKKETVMDSPEYKALMKRLEKYSKKYHSGLISAKQYSSAVFRLTNSMIAKK